MAAERRWLLAADFQIKFKYSPRVICGRTIGVGAHVLCIWILGCLHRTR